LEDADERGDDQWIAEYRKNEGPPGAPATAGAKAGGGDSSRLTIGTQQTRPRGEVRPAAVEREAPAMPT
jgi:hypothetical protein